MMLDSLIVEFYILTIALHKPFCSHESFKKKKRRKKKTVLVNISVILQTAVICHCGSLGIINHVVFNKSIRVEMTHIQYVINTRCHLDGLKFKWYKNSVFLTGSDSLWLLSWRFWNAGDSNGASLSGVYWGTNKIHGDNPGTLDFLEQI